MVDIGEREGHLTIGMVEHGAEDRALELGHFHVIDHDRTFAAAIGPPSIRMIARSGTTGDVVR